MKFNKSMMKLYAITDQSWLNGKTLYEQVEEALKGGVTCVQLREKTLDEDVFLLEARELVSLCHRYNVPLIINDNIEIALKSKADGVHLGQDDACIEEARKVLGQNAIIGVSTHTVDEAIKACQKGADYFGAGAVFVSNTKTNTIPMSKETLKQICEVSSVPVVAIGGITKERLSYFKATGIDGVALISAVFNNENIEEACKELHVLLDEIVRGNGYENSFNNCGK